MQFEEYLETAEKFHELACNEPPEGTGNRYVVASVLFSWIAMEAFVNHMMEDFAAIPPELFTVHERGFLQEREVEFSMTGDTLGQFVIKNSRKYQNIGNKIAFLIARFSPGTKIDKGSTFWQRFEAAKGVRDALSHPRKGVDTSISPEEAWQALEVARDVIRFLGIKVWGKTIEV
ncbi:MAG: hypothetical protein NTZ04_07145 [Chloroflexi bacterium]|nr:hypothetical protein [Chloroflexota bacterium]